MAIVATGFFDGVHSGHREVLKHLVELARERKEESVVVTFWPHPRNVLQSDARSLRLLTSLKEKLELIYAIGVDRVEVLPFTKDFSALTMEEYVRDILMDRFRATAILLGYDNRLGSDGRSGETVRKIAAGYGLDTYLLPSVNTDDSVAVSSTRIRASISSGNVADAAEMLGYDYFINGVVVSGQQLGRKLGYPTANVQLYEPLKLLPGNGVYAVEVETLGHTYRAMCNVGVRPTIGNGKNRTIETNIFEFDEDIYGLDIKVTFLGKVRDEIHFGNIDELKTQLAKDKIMIQNGNWNSHHLGTRHSFAVGEIQ